MTTPPAQQLTGAQQQALAIACATAMTAPSVPAAMTTLGSVLDYLGIRREVGEAALEIVMGHPPDAAGFYGPATANVARINLIRRGMFAAASIMRLAGDDELMQAGAEAGIWTTAVNRERGYYGQQLVAGWNREKAGAAVDSASMTHGRLLGWYTRIDARTSAECRAANRHNFNADEPPAIGYPGMVHPHCRCQPGAPFPGARMVGAATVGSRDSRKRGITGVGRPVPDHRPHADPARAGVGR